MNIKNAEFLQSFAKSLHILKEAGEETVGLSAEDFGIILGLAQSGMWEAELLKARHCHHGHGEGAHTHGQQTCIECAGVVTYHMDYTDYGDYPDIKADQLKQHYVGRMVYGEAYKG